MLQPRVAPSSKRQLVKADPAEHRMQLFCAANRIPDALEAWQLVVDLLEGDPVAAVVTAGVAEGDLAAEMSPTISAISRTR